MAEHKPLNEMTEKELHSIGWLEQEKFNDLQQKQNTCQQNLNIIRQELNVRMRKNGEQIKELADDKNMKELAKSIVKKK